MNTATNMKQRFSPHQFALYRHVWTLNQTEHDALDRCFMLKTIGSHLESLINTNHEWKDIIINNGIQYELSYQDCGVDSLTRRLANSTLLLQFRYSSFNRMAVCLVKEPFANANLTHYKDL